MSCALEQYKVCLFQTSCGTVANFGVLMCFVCLASLGRPYLLPLYMFSLQGLSCAWIRDLFRTEQFHTHTHMFGYIASPFEMGGTQIWHSRTSHQLSINALSTHLKGQSSWSLGFMGTLSAFPTHNFYGFLSWPFVTSVLPTHITKTTKTAAQGFHLEHLHKIISPSKTPKRSQIWSFRSERRQAAQHLPHAACAERSSELTNVQLVGFAVMTFCRPV